MYDNLCDPFTGIPLDNIEFTADNFIYTHPITGKKYHGCIDHEYEYICMPIEACYDMVCTAKDAATILDVTKARISQACKNGLLESGKIGDSLFISKASIDEYASTERKPGRKPEKWRDVEWHS